MDPCTSARIADETYLTGAPDKFFRRERRHHPSNPKAPELHPLETDLILQVAGTGTAGADVGSKRTGNRFLVSSPSPYVRFRVTTKGCITLFTRVSARCNWRPVELCFFNQDRMPDAFQRWNRRNGAGEWVGVFTCNSSDFEL